MFRNTLNDTIAAIATPLGKAGIGIVRLSGPEALKIADGIFLAKDNSKPSACKGYTAHYGWIIEKNPQADKKAGKEKVIDEALLVVMRAPRSYTKEDIVEINCHSGIVVLKEVLELILKKGARLAEAGEFTKRAFLNGRIDLSQAEAVLDVINSKTSTALENSQRQLRGDLSRRIKVISRKLLDCLVGVEASIDFPEENIESLEYGKLKVAVEDAYSEITGLASTFNSGKVLREGINVVIIGRANVGKSSLLNVLLKEERAIVTPIAGTTRDSIEEVIDLRGIPLKIADTAGIIEPRDFVERQALKVTQKRFACADLVLLAFDAGKPLSAQDRQLIKKAKRKQTIAVINKVDLKQKLDKGYIRSCFDKTVEVSCITAQGIRELEDSIVSLFWAGKLEASADSIITNSRHRQSLTKAKEALEGVLRSLKSKISAEFVAEDLKACRRFLGEITGETVQEDILEKIFSEFCIGK